MGLTEPVKDHFPTGIGAAVIISNVRDGRTSMTDRQVKPVGKNVSRDGEDSHGK